MSANVSRLLTHISTGDGPGDLYDHEIALIDATAPANPDGSRSHSPSPSRGKLPRSLTKTSVKEQLAKRKYAKWQEHRYPSKTGGNFTTNDADLAQDGGRPDDGRLATQTETVDFAPAQPPERGRLLAHKRRQESKQLKEQVYEIDILYENQRGSFFCGIPLYSHSSLLPTDPKPWVNKDFKDSPVNITNAQVPDPSWEWAWKTWYVDMSYDVDEEGWQYAFTFGRKFAWHGTHPWLYSFVRRRRWLRKRVKRELRGGHDKPGSMGAAHHLSKDYFTIHSKRDRSPVSVVDGAGKTARPSSFISYPSTLDDDLLPEDIKDIASLLRALRIAAIDREKVDAVKQFVQQGGDELAYLKDHIAEIMSFFIFQSSRTELLSYLQELVSQNREGPQGHDRGGRPGTHAAPHRTDDILAAINAANEQARDLEFWHDMPDRSLETEGDSVVAQAIAPIFDKSASNRDGDGDSVEKIRGIPEKADVARAPTKSFLSPSRHASVKTDGEKGTKGKGKAPAEEDPSGDPSDERRLGPDQVLIPDED